jgi:hypothetical protein
MIIIALPDLCGCDALPSVCEIKTKIKKGKNKRQQSGQKSGWIDRGLHEESRIEEHRSETYQLVEIFDLLQS